MRLFGIVNGRDIHTVLFQHFYQAIEFLQGRCLRIDIFGRLKSVVHSCFRIKGKFSRTYQEEMRSGLHGV